MRSNADKHLELSRKRLQEGKEGKRLYLPNVEAAFQKGMIEKAARDKRDLEIQEALLMLYIIFCVIILLLGLIT